MKSFEYAIASRHIITGLFGGRKLAEIQLHPDLGGRKPPVFLSRTIILMNREGNVPLIL